MGHLLRQPQLHFGREVAQARQEPVEEAELVLGQLGGPGLDGLFCRGGRGEGGESVVDGPIPHQDG